MRRSERQRGLTLIEITIALGIAAMATAVAVISLNALTDAALRSSAVDITGAIKYSYDRAIMQKRVQRIAFDIDKGLWWLEFTEDPYAVASERLTGESGAQVDQERVEEAVEEGIDSFFDVDRAEGAEVKRALEGGRGAAFSPDTEAGKPNPLPGGVQFSRVWTGHQEKPFTKGVAYLHFFRGGWTEPAQIELVDGGEDYITLKVAPLTGRVRMYPEKFETPELEEWTGRKEGDE